ncbi:isochorismate synthase [Synechococcus sp. Nb3U1]|uniref:isochorismate synthase n=1 Tax=Synechococcus sp. Nb3U1 TaxID=1914529 RepID=UPI001F00732C|nr:isochorismate synthase [Synechococcus sp. Nb3U1]
MAACQQMARARGIPQILSLSRSFSGLDPLVVLAQTLGPNRRSGPEDPSYCYLSHRARHGTVRVLGLGSLRRVYLLGEGRFQASQAFLEELQPHLHAEAVGWGSLALPSGSGQERPLCFSRFSFNPVRASASVAQHTCGPAALLVLPEWQIWQEQEPTGSVAEGARTVVRLNLEVMPESDLAVLGTRIHHCFAHMSRLSQQQLPRWELQTPLQVEVNRQGLLARIDKALQAIRSGSLEKVVLAEAVDLPLATPPPIPTLLAYLEQRYADCSVFAFAEGIGRREAWALETSGQGQPAPFPERVFLGASPERLLSVWQGQIQIDALAGSVARGETVSQDQALAQQLLESPKDRQEHQLVVRSVGEALRQVGLKPRIPSQPRLLRLANIQHLQTLIQAEMPPDLHLFDLLAQLHPTAAVGGYPKQAAVDWIEAAEPFDRSGYAAPLGWVDLQGNGEFVVAIRSALIRGDRARLYAGAGIVADSCPEQEVAEIRLKLQSLAQALAIK